MAQEEMLERALDLEADLAAEARASVFIGHVRVSP
jgi:hypothetical protein